MRYFNPAFITRPPLVVTWNQQDKSANIDLTNGLLTATANSGTDGAVRATIVRAAGLWYAELNMGTLGGGDSGGGLANATAILDGTGCIGQDVNLAVMQFKGGNLYNNGALQFGNGNMAGGGILQVAYNGTTHKAWLKFAAGNWNNNASNNPATGVGGLDVSAFDSVGLYPCFCAGGTSDACTANFGATSFSFTLPAGFTAWKG